MEFGIAIIINEMRKQEKYLYTKSKGKREGKYEDIHGIKYQKNMSRYEKKNMTKMKILKEKKWLNFVHE